MADISIVEIGSSSDGGSPLPRRPQAIAVPSSSPPRIVKQTRASRVRSSPISSALDIPSDDPLESVLKAMRPGGAPKPAPKDVVGSEPSIIEMFSSPPKPKRNRLSSKPSPGHDDAYMSLSPPPTKRRKSAEENSMAPPKRKSSTSEAEKIRKQIEKDRQKSLKAAEAAAKKAHKDANKLRSSKTDAAREIRVHCAPDLVAKKAPLEPVLAAIQAKFAEHGSLFEVEPQAVPGLITFERWTEATYDAGKKAFIPLPARDHAWILEQVVLLVVKGAVVAEQVAQGTLSDWYAGEVARVRDRHPTVNQVFLVLHDLKGYYAKVKRERDKAFAARARAVADGKQVTAEEDDEAPDKDVVEMELVRLQMKEKCWQIQINTKTEMEEWMWNLAADLAIKPYKLIQKAHLAFSIRDGPATRKGQNPKDAFELMLGEMEGVTPSGAEGITKHYKSFRAMMEAYDAMEAQRKSQKELEEMVAGCIVLNNRTGVDTRRPLGKAVSRHVYDTMRGKDGLALT